MAKNVPNNFYLVDIYEKENGMAVPIGIKGIVQVNILEGTRKDGSKYKTYSVVEPLIGYAYDSFDHESSCVDRHGNEARFGVAYFVKRGDINPLNLASAEDASNYIDYYYSEDYFLATELDIMTKEGQGKEIKKMFKKARNGNKL